MEKYWNQQDVRGRNLTSIYRLIRHAGPITRRQIEGQMELSWGAVSGATALLLREGYIKEVKSEGCGGAGRTPVMLCVNEQDHLFLGMDINRSGLTGTVLSPNGTPLLTLRQESAASSTEQCLEEIGALARALIAAVPGKRVQGVGVAMQGAVDAENGISLSFPIPDWQNVPLAELLAEDLGLPVFLEHDPNCILYAAAPKAKRQSAILLRVDHGIGMAVMTDGEIFARCGALELGYTLNEGLLLQEVATVQALEEQAGMPMSALTEAARTGASAPLAALERAAHHLACAILNTARLFCVNSFLLCGRMAGLEDLLLPRVRQALDKYPLHPPITLTLTDVSNAAVGAALLAMERCTLNFDEQRR